MSDLAAKVQSLEKKLNEFKSMVTALLPIVGYRQWKLLEIEGEASECKYALMIIVLLNPISRWKWATTRDLDVGRFLLLIKLRILPRGLSTEHQASYHDKSKLTQRGIGVNRQSYLCESELVPQQFCSRAARSQRMDGI